MVEEQLAIIDRLAARKPQYSEVLGVYRQLAELINETPAPLVSPFENIRENVKKRSGVPLFDRQDLPVDLETASLLLSRFMENLLHMDRDDKQGLATALEISNNDPAWSTDLFEAILREDEEALEAIGENVGLEPAGLRFLALIALSPAMEALRNSVSDRIDSENRDSGHCPLCGSKPDMAYFDTSGKRYLHCELCSTEWLFKRIGCPFCGNQDHEKLGYLEPEQEEGYRIYLCKECLKYLKTVDKRVFDETIPMVLENLVTLHLDLIAIENDFG